MTVLAQNWTKHFLPNKRRVLPNFYPNLPIFLYPSYPWHFATLSPAIHLLLTVGDIKDERATSAGAGSAMQGRSTFQGTSASLSLDPTGRSCCSIEMHWTQLHSTLNVMFVRRGLMLNTTWRLTLQITITNSRSCWVEMQSTAPGCI